MSGLLAASFATIAAPAPAPPAAAFRTDRFIATLSALVAAGLLGALMAFSDTPWYSGYAAMGLSGTAGLTPLEDQQLAGLIMWVPGGAVHAIAALVYFSRWFGGALEDPPSFPRRRESRGSDSSG